MQVSFALFADAANLSQEGKLNILGVFDALQVGSLPTVHPRAHLVVHLKGTQMDVGPHTVTLRWVNMGVSPLIDSPLAPPHAARVASVAPLKVSLR